MEKTGRVGFGFWFCLGVFEVRVACLLLLWSACYAEKTGFPNWSESVALSWSELSFCVRGCLLCSPCNFTSVIKLSA